jgi:DNA processing protein
VKLSKRQRDLLHICALPGVPWNAIAREAQRPQGLERLLEGDVSEQGAEARKARKALKKGLAQIEQAKEKVAEAEALAKSVGAKLTTALPEEDDYPINLRVIYNLPPFLFYRGELRRDDARSVAVVGSRKASEAGLRRAAKIAKSLVQHEVTVLSGLAKGIDAAAHTSAIAAGGRTIAVIGTGILQSYPKENADLQEQIAQEGALVSQFWPDHPPTQRTFPMRNVVMSGMSQGTIVVEANSRSGAKMQARLALEHRKQAFLLRTLVASQDWAQEFVSRGAIEVSDLDDVLTLLRSAEQIENLNHLRRQLVLEPA